jgi:putative phosphoribosyl transferase
VFSDRVDAGKQLAGRLGHLRGDDVVVVGLPRGGVPVAAEVARALDAPLDVIVVRKLGVPFQPELGMGALGEDGVKVLNPDVIAMAGVTDRELAAVEAQESAELRRRAERFRADRERVPLTGRVVVVVDDGVATGSTARAACQVARAHGAARVILAVPVAPVDWTRRLAGAADELVCVATPTPFFGIGQFYDDFSQTTDDEVIRHLRAAAAPAAPTSPEPRRPVAGDDPPVRDEEVEVEAGPVRLGGHLTVPDAARAVVVFAHGSGSSRHSPRNRYVATVLNDAGLATLLFDLLTPAEESDRANVFDIGLLGQRLAAVTAWVRQLPDVAGLPVGYFGASTGAAAALAAAAAPDAETFAVVSRGGRPDLAGRLLGSVRAPTLLIVGGRDDVVLGLNREAQARLRCPSQLTVIPGATHLFEEPGTLQAAAAAARDWFLEHAPRAQKVAS